MEWCANNLKETVFIIGIVLLIIEILVLGLSTFVLFFAGLAAIAASGIMWAGLLPETFLYAMFSVTIFTLIFSALLWKPLLRLQKTADVKPTHNDIVGLSFMLEHDIIATSAMELKPTYLYSGISWRLDADQDIQKGRLVEVTQTEVGILRVKEKQG